MSHPSKRSSGLLQFTLKVFSLVTIKNERVVIFESCDVTFFSLFSHFGAENRQLFARVCARSISPSVVLSVICVTEVCCPGNRHTRFLCMLHDRYLVTKALESLQKKKNQYIGPLPHPLPSLACSSARSTHCTSH